MNIKIVKSDGWEKTIATKTITFDNGKIVLKDMNGVETVLTDTEVKRIDLIESPSFYGGGIISTSPFPYTVDDKIIPWNNMSQGT